MPSASAIQNQNCEGEYRGIPCNKKLIIEGKLRCTRCHTESAVELGVAVQKCPKCSRKLAVEGTLKCPRCKNKKKIKEEKSMLKERIVKAPNNILAIPERIAQDAVYERTASEAIGHLKRCLGIPLVCDKCGKPAEYTLNRVGRCSEDMPPIIKKGWEVIRVRTIRLDNWGAEGCTLRASQGFLPGGNVTHRKVDGKIYRMVERGYFQDIPDEFYRLIALAKLAKKEGISHICAANGEIWTSPGEAPEGKIVPWREVADVTAIFSPNGYEV